MPTALITGAIHGLGLEANPGWVRSGMGGEDARFNPATFVGSMIRVVTGAAPADNGNFNSHDGVGFLW